MTSTIDRPISEPTALGDLDLSHENLRIIKAQQLINDAAEMWDNYDDPADIPDDDLELLRNTFSEAGMHLKIADQQPYVDTVKAAVNSVERFRNPDDFNIDTDDIRDTYLLKCRIEEATTLTPTTEL